MKSNFEVPRQLMPGELREDLAYAKSNSLKICAMAFVTQKPIRGAPRRESRR